MNVLMLVMTDVAHDARVLREAGTLAGEGHAVHIVGKDVPAGWTPPAGVTVESVSGGSGLKPSGGADGARGPHGPHDPHHAGGPSTGNGGAGASSGPVAGSPLRRAARWALLPQHRQRVWRTWCGRAGAAVAGREFDVVHAHDFNVLILAADLADRTGARLVYDSHEWWSGRERHGRPTPLERARERRVEQRLAARADAVVTVSDGIARRLGRWHGRPVAVVRNTFPLLGESTTALAERPRGVVYAGRIGPARDIETLLAATAAAGLETLLLGKVDREFLSTIRVSTGTLRIEPARPVDAVDEALRRVGISVVSLTDTCENHRLALPNKVFHAVRAGVPVVAADLPELRLLVTKYGLGTLYRPGDAESMRTALKQLAADYPRWCAQVAAARGELNWDHDAATLVGVYEALARDTTTAGVR